MPLHERERCPNDGSEIFYRTDWLGRLAGFCPTCAGRFWKSCVPDRVTIEPELISEFAPGMNREALEEIDEAVEQVVRAVPMGLSLADIVSEANYTKQRVKMAIARLRKAGALGYVEVATNGARRRRMYYHTSHEAPPSAEPIKDTAERVYTALERLAGHWRRSEDIARVLGTPTLTVSQAVGYLYKHKGIEKQRRQTGGHKCNHYRVPKPRG